MTRHARFGLAALAAATVTLAGCARPENSAPAAGTTAAANSAATAAATGAYLPDPKRQFAERVLWGDEHVHSGWSADAGLGGTTLGPEDAVRFARGEEVKSSTGVMMKLHRPLDWVAVTEHSDGMGVINELGAGNKEMLADAQVKRWYDMMQQGIESGMKAKREVQIAQATGKGPKVLKDPKWMVSAWQKSVDIMERYNEPGKFTALIAYEWTSNGERGQNLHRNVIFRDDADKTRDRVPLATFVSALPERSGSDPESLWKWLADYERQTGGQVLAIPHNGNLSNGWMFRETRYDGSPITAEWAATRQRWEPLYELYQYKGSSEAHPAIAANDELANFGIWDTADLNANPKQPGDIRTEYWREALKNGLKREGKVGANPFKYGAAAGTDTHTALMAQEEDNFGGKFVQSEPGNAKRWDNLYKQEGSYTRKDWTLMAQGTMGVWATANTRAAIWDAMKRRETYASSGPRLTVRFFGGFELAGIDARGPTMVATAYARGVPMGGDLKTAPAGKAPTFLYSVLKDPAGANLDCVQVIKGWVDARGETHERIYNLAWSETDRRKETAGKLTPVGNTVDMATATYANSIGAAELAGSFTDPEFDPSLRAFYYLRAVEIPTPRWTLYDAVRFKLKMSPGVPMIHQERVVTSPIWYNPGP